MTLSIATSYSQQATIDWRALSNAQAGDWVVLTEHQHLVWARFTAEWGGHIFDPPFERSATGYGYPANSNSRDISEVSCAGTAEKRLQGDVVRVGMAVFGTNLDIRLTITNQRTATTFSAIEASLSTSDTEWVIASADLDYADVVESGVADLLTCKLEARSRDGSTGSLYAIRVGEIEISATSDIPGAILLPTAAASGPSDGEMGTAETLDASGSVDPDGSIVSYDWTLVSSPGSHTLSTTDYDTVTPEVTIETGSAEGDYTWEVEVTDDDGLTDTAQHTISWEEPNTAPTASATGPTSVTEQLGWTYQDDGSSDPEDGSNLDYLWYVSPPGSASYFVGSGSGFGYSWTVTNATASVTDIVFDQPGSWDVQLEVTDQDGADDSDNISVTVNEATPTADLTVSDASPDEGDTITLDASGSTGNETPLSYSYTATVEPTTNYSLTDNGDTATVDLNADDSAGDYTFEVTVTDSDGDSDTDTVNVSVNAVAEASISGATTVTEGVAETYDASGSQDEDSGDSISSYSWSVTSSPNGQASDYTLSSTSGSSIDFTADVNGSFDLQVQVTSTDGTTDSETISISAPNQAPTARITGPQEHGSAEVTATYHGDGGESGTASSDPDGTVDSYAWFMTNTPNGSPVEPADYDIASPNSASTQVTFNVSGGYTLVLEVTDDDGDTDSTSINVTVA